MKIRTIITQDAEVDDQNSLRHFLLYSNEVELQGIVQTSSKFHWQGVPGAETKKVLMPGELSGDKDEGTYDKPYRWPGTEWMQQVLDDYEKDYPNLCRHAEGYPTPAYLRGITKVGNIGYKGETAQPTEGSELIRKAILDADERTLYIQVWGGCNTIVRALMDIEAAYGNAPEWPQMYEKITRKVVITACGEQDETYRTYLAEKWPRMQFVKTLQMGSYAYPWLRMPEGESKDTLRAEFMKKEILNGKSALASGYCTWLDGVYYEGEEQASQFGANPNIGKEWFGSWFGLPAGEPFDFLSEGDSPTFFPLFNWGFRTLEDFSYGGIAGRYHLVPGEVNSKGEALNIWDVSRDEYTDRDGQVHVTESMWPYVSDIQRDFAARVAWAAADTFEKGEHAPKLEIREGVDLSAKPGEKITLHADAVSPDNLPVHVSFRVYQDAGPEWAKGVAAVTGETYAEFTLPADAVPGEKFHIIVKAQAEGHHRLVHYRQVIVTVK